jgi:regulator of replication initiation timing
MATQNTKTKTTLADKDKKVLMILGALVILALAWFLGYQKFNEQRETVVTENDQLAMEVSQLRAKVSKKAQVEADTEKKNARTEQVLLAYPSELRTQDAINRFDQLEKKVKGLTITTENFTMNQIFFQDGAALEEVVAQNADSDAQSKDANGGNSTASGNNTQNSTNNTANAATNETAAADNAQNAQSTDTGNYTGYRSDVGITFATDYKSLKSVLNFINNYSERMNVSNVNISSDEGSKALQCTMTVQMFSVGGQAKEYKDLTLSGVPLRKDNIFQ